MADHPHFCAIREYIGLSRPGALAEYVVLPADVFCRVPNDVSDAETAALQPLALALLCVVDAGVDPEPSSEQAKSMEVPYGEAKRRRFTDLLPLDSWVDAQDVAEMVT